MAEVCRVEEVYRAPVLGGGSSQSPVRDIRPAVHTSAVIAAYHQRLAAGGEPLMMAWHRPRLGGPVDVVCTTHPAGASEPSALVFPPGTRGRRVDRRGLGEALSAMKWWVPIAAATDALLVPTLAAERTLSRSPASLEETLLAAWQGPFAWLLVALPIGPEDLDGHARRAAADEHDARARSSAPQHAVAAERAARRHLEIRAGASAGMWRVHLLAGGSDAPSAAAVAALLVAGHDLSGTPFALAPMRPVLGFGEALAIRKQSGEHTYPFLAGSPLVATLAQVPATEIPGVRLIERSTFDVTSETQVSEADSVELGTVLDHDDLAAGTLRIALGSLNRHVFVCGATGAGKSQTVRTLLEGLSTRPEPVPWLVIEPAKAEYARMAGRLPADRPVLVIRPGEPDVIPACLNPLEPEPGFPLQTHIDLLRALFLASFDAVEPFPQILSHALTRCYQQAGWDVALSRPRNPDFEPRFPNLGDLRRVALQVVDEIGYARDVTDNVRGFIDVRIGSLRLGTPGRFFEGGHPLDVAELLERNVVLELEDIGNDQDKAFFIGAVLIRITEHLRTRATAGPVHLRHVTVIEEAHRLLKHADPGSPAAHAVELFAGLLAEIRAYGEGIVVAEQIPDKIITDVLKNSAVKIVHRLPALDDRTTVGATMNLADEQSRYLVTLPPGRAAVFTDGMDKALLVAMPLREDREDATGVDRDPPVSQRAVACGSSCQARRCTLREIATAADLADDPRLTLWIETLAITHITGDPAPRPDPAWLHRLHADHDTRTLECALAHRVQAAIESRYEGLAAWYSPEALAAHLAVVAGRQLTGCGDPAGCDGTETHWQSGRHRWTDVARALLAQKDRSAPAHPNTTAWRTRGLDLPGTTIAEQLVALDRHPDTYLPTAATVNGYGNPPTIDLAAARLSNAADPTERVRQAAAFLEVDTVRLARVLFPHGTGTSRDVIVPPVASQFRATSEEEQR